MSALKIIFPCTSPKQNASRLSKPTRVDAMLSMSRAPKTESEFLRHSDFAHRSRANDRNRESQFARMSPSCGCSRDLAECVNTRRGSLKMWRTEMAIYTRMGAPVQILGAELRRRWWISYGHRTNIFDAPPTAADRKGAKEESEFDIWWIKAKQIGLYPDGSGERHVGKVLDYGKDGWLDENEFRADDGIREIHAECESISAVQKITQAFNRGLKRAVSRNAVSRVR